MKHPMDDASSRPAPSRFPPWARELVTLYESGAASQFVLHGNVHDRMVLPLVEPRVGTLRDFLLEVLLPRFDVVLTYDLGNGIRVRKGDDVFEAWAQTAKGKQLPKTPRAAVETLTHYFRYLTNLRVLGRDTVQVGLVVRDAHLVVPATQGGVQHELAALASLIRDWANESQFAEHPMATFLVTENVRDLHPLLANNTRTPQVKIPLPSVDELASALRVLAPTHPTALEQYADDPATPARQLVGSTLGAVESLLRTREHRGAALVPDDLVRLKKSLVERDCNGLIQFIESDDTLDRLHGQEAIKRWLRQDLELWRRGDLQAMPMGYLLSGPVGTGKTFLVRCLAGEAGVPVVKINNFRDRWIGSTEGNLERIFRLLQALGRCIVFVDEADQSLGRRESSSGDSGLSGRIYSMIAQEMSRTANRGRIVWVLASSRPDLIEVDLKRPGRIDVKLPIFPTTTAEEGFALIRALCGRREIELTEDDFEALEDLVPDLLTPGAAEALAVKVYRTVRTEDREPLDAVRDALADYRNPVPADVLEFQIRLAIQETTDVEFIPERIQRAFGARSV